MKKTLVKHYPTGYAEAWVEDSEIVIYSDPHPEKPAREYRLEFASAAEAKRIFKQGWKAIEAAFNASERRRNPVMPWQRKGAGRWGRKHGVLVWIPARKSLKKRKPAKAKAAKRRTKRSRKVPGPVWTHAGWAPEMFR